MNWKRIAVTPDTLIIDTLSVIDAGGCQAALVVNNDSKLLGIVSDGDIRRGIIRGIDVHAPVREVMTPTPLTIPCTQNFTHALRLMRVKELRQLPVIDESGCVCDFWTQDDLLKKTLLPNPVILMAGGLGTRLAPLTDNCPKPLLKVGGKPILETIVENFIDCGFSKFYLSINYRGDMIEDYFGDGSRWDVSIDYLRENKRLGTAGALSLLSEPPEYSCIVMNGDLLTRLQGNELIMYHEACQAPATMVVKNYEQQVPYGVVCSDHDNRITALEEKPVNNYQVSAGIYALAPEAFELIPKNTFYDMPDLFRALLQKGKAPSVYQLNEYWMDIGRGADYQRANEDYSSFFEDVS